MLQDALFIHLIWASLTEKSQISLLLDKYSSAALKSRQKVTHSALSAGGGRWLMSGQQKACDGKPDNVL